MKNLFLFIINNIKYTDNKKRKNQEWIKKIESNRNI